MGMDTYYHHAIDESHCFICDSGSHLEDSCPHRERSPSVHLLRMSARVLRATGGTDDYGNLNLREGQSVMIALFDTNKALYNKYSGTIFDCFYHDDRIGDLMLELNREDENTPT